MINGATAGVCSDLMLSDKARDSLELAFVNITCVYIIYMSLFIRFLYIFSLFHWLFCNYDGASRFIAHAIQLSYTTCRMHIIIKPQSIINSALFYCQLFSTTASIKDSTLHHDIGFKYCTHYFVMGTEENSIWLQWNGNWLSYLCIGSICTVILPFVWTEWSVISCKYENNKGRFNRKWSRDILIYRFYNRESHKRGDDQHQRFECPREAILCQ